MNEQEKTTLVDLTSDEILHDPDPSFSFLLQEFADDVKVLVEEGKDVVEAIKEMIKSSDDLLAYGIEMGMDVYAQFEAKDDRGVVRHTIKNPEKVMAILERAKMTE